MATSSRRRRPTESTPNPAPREGPGRRASHVPPGRTLLAACDPSCVATHYDRVIIGSGDLRRAACLVLELDMGPSLGHAA